MQMTDAARGPTGHFHMEVLQGGVLIETVDEPNLVVAGSRTAHALLIGGTTGNQVSQFGVGTNGVAPVDGNTALTGAFQKAIDSVTYVSAGVVAFNFSLGSAEANGIAIMEFGIFTAAGALYARKVRSAALGKASDISITGAWTITFS